ncbi:helix-turn-helix domain-containing protein [Rhodococcus ruber]|uniref:helix-turn-helix domain-containing protein n=1 Tax=Rhodococcus ruber TaxID=1830 RepID=UPI003D81BE21
MAEYLGVARNTVSTWINGRIEPSTQTLRLWALRTGVPFIWLQTGTAPSPDGGDGAAVVRHQGLEPRTR